MGAHAWAPSKLGHGELMCSRCFVTNREAAVLGMTECDAPAPSPPAANENAAPARTWTQDEIDNDMGQPFICPVRGMIDTISAVYVGAPLEHRTQAPISLELEPDERNPRQQTDRKGSGNRQGG